MDIIQRFTGTEDRLNCYGVLFKMNTTGATKTLTESFYGVTRIVLKGPSTSSGTQYDSYMNVFVKSSGSSSYTYLTSSKNATKSAVGQDGDWRFDKFNIYTSSAYLLTFSTAPSTSLSSFNIQRIASYNIVSTDGGTQGVATTEAYASTPYANIAYLPIMTIYTNEGSIDMTRGYYNNGTTQIFMDNTTSFLTHLYYGQTVGNKCNIFATTYNGSAKPVLSALNTPTGTYDATVNLNHPVYLTHLNDVLLGDKVEDIKLNVASPTLNYTVTGSTRVDSAYEAAVFGTSSYLVSTAFSDYAAGTVSSFELAVKVKTPVSWNSNGRILNWIGVNYDTTNGPFIEGQPSSIKLVFYDGDTYYNFDAVTSVENNKDYWLKWVYDGTNVSSYYKTAEDDEYTLNETKACSSSIPRFLGSSKFSIGARANNQALTVWNGFIDLKGFYLKVNGTEAWRALGDATGLRNGGDVKWTYLGSTIYINDTDVSAASLQTVSGESKALTMYVCGTNSLSSNISGMALAGTETTYMAPYLGYELVFTDTDYDTVSTLTKVGTRCRIYRGSYDESNDYIIAVPVSQYENGEVTGTIYYTTFDSSKTTKLPIAVENSTSTYTYKNSTDTLTYDGVACSFVDEYFVNV